MSTDTRPEITEKEPKEEQLLALIAIGKHLHEIAENSRRIAKDTDEISDSLKSIRVASVLMLIALIIFLWYMTKGL